MSLRKLENFITKHPEYEQRIWESSQKKQNKQLLYKGVQSFLQ